MNKVKITKSVLGTYDVYLLDGTRWGTGFVDVLGAIYYAHATNCEIVHAEDASIEEITKLVTERELWSIGNHIEQDWIGGVHEWAVGYVDAMKCLCTMDDYYGADSASNIVAYGLGNMTSWNTRKSKMNRDLKIPFNKIIKEELKKRLK